MNPTLRDLACLVLAGAFLFSFQTGARDLWNPNEPVYGLAAREMVERGDWTQPTVEGRPFDEKPIGYFWAAGVFGRIWGVNEVTLRLPSAWSGILLLLFAYLWVLPMLGRRRALWTTAVLATTYVVFWQARTIQMDLMLTAATTGVVLALHRIGEGGHTRFWTVFGGVCLGAGLLAKGPVAAITAGLPLAAWAAWTRRPARRFLGAAAGVGALGLALAAPWYLGQARTGDGLTEVLVRQNFSRFVDAWDHRKPFWYYGVQLWIDFAPWVWCLPFAVGRGAGDDRAARWRKLAWLWIVLTVLFFSLSDSKRSVYLLPAAAPIAALVADALVALIDGQLGGWRRRGLLTAHAITGGILLAAGVAALRELPGRFPEIGAAGTVVGWSVALCGAAIAAAVAVHRLRPAWATRVSVVALASAFLVITAVGLPAFDRYKSARALGEWLAASVPERTHLIGYDLWPWRAEYTFYSHRPLDRVDDDAYLSRLAGKRPVCALAENDARERLRELMPDAAVAREERIGSRDVLVLCTPGALGPAPEDERPLTGRLH